MAKREEKARIRLDRMLTELGQGSRAEVKNLIRAGRVRVNGAVEKDGGRKILTAEDSVSVDGKDLSYRRFYYYILHKPVGCISSTEKGPTPTVMDVLEEAMAEAGDACPLFHELSPVGRLDIDTTGLLLITNDGALSHALLAPGRHVEKCYRAVCKGIPGEEAEEVFRKGMDLGDFVTKPAGLTVESQDTEADTSVCLVTIHEGKFHQVKRMMAAVGCEVMKLHRLTMGPLSLPEDLPAGTYRPLTEEELKALKERS